MARIAPAAIRSAAANTAVGRLGELEERHRLGVPGLRVEIAFAHERLAVIETQPLELPAVAEQPVDAGPAVLGTADQRDAAVPELGQMPDRGRRAVHVVRHDVAHAGAVDVEVDRHRGDARRQELLDLRVVAVDAHHDQTVHPVLAGAGQVPVLGSTRAGTVSG